MRKCPPRRRRAACEQRRRRRRRRKHEPCVSKAVMTGNTLTPLGSACASRSPSHCSNPQPDLLNAITTAHQPPNLQPRTVLTQRTCPRRAGPRPLMKRMMRLRLFRFRRSPLRPMQQPPDHQRHPALWRRPPQAQLARAAQLLLAALAQHSTTKSRHQKIWVDLSATRCRVPRCRRQHGRAAVPPKTQR